MMSNLPKAQVASMKLNSNTQLRRRTVRKKVDIDNYDTEMITAHSNIPYVTNANGELIPGVLVYVMEGVLPLIKVWMHVYYMYM